MIAIFDVNLAGDFSLLFQQKRPLSPFLAADQVHPDFHYIYPSLCQPQPARLLKGYMQVILSHFFDRLTLVEEKYNPSTDLTHQALLFVMAAFSGAALPGKRLPPAGREQIPPLAHLLQARLHQF